VSLSRPWTNRPS